ncbi:MarR family transcriptional regulator [Natrinema halophilum]|uniref:MarR family transcriptional regulator n=1 Tax=Natrinema halophilum TaxID=1699371 RepID=A0A7D5K5Q7_9EURY|nr:helix-turn-helix domain-containing protein [Natrinema halophilum]QLG48583.1 MarR family transcriptional regulator [Natrinema halophilum]
MSATEPDTDVDEAAETDESDGSGHPSQNETVPADLPPSAKLVYKVLEYEEPLTQEGIADESRLCPRTVRYALGKLEEQELVSSRVSLEDARQSQYRIGEVK